MQPPTALSCPPSPAAPTLAEYVGGLFENAPCWLHCNGLGSPFLLKLPPLVARHASMVSPLPPCFNGYTSAAVPQWLHIRRHASMVSHLPPCLNGLTFAALPRWSHIRRPASMVSHLPPRLNGLTSAAMPQWLHNTLHASRADQLPRHHIHPEIRHSAVSLLPLGLAPRLSCLVIQRAAKRGGGLHERIRCVWQSATHIEDVARLTI